MIWADNMLVPNKATHKGNAEKWINYYYEPEVAAKLAAYDLVHLSRQGRAGGHGEGRPDHVDNELIFPTDKTLSTTHAFMELDAKPRAQVPARLRDVDRWIARLTSSAATPARRAPRLSQLTKEFASFTAVKALDLEVPQGSFFALLGPSGCGKTTTLRMVAGLETPTSGTIHLGDTEITYEKPYKRPVNTVFQNYALFPHLDISKNVAFGLSAAASRMSSKQVADMLELVELYVAGAQEAGPDVGRPAAAGRPGSRADQPARGAPARRAAGRARPQAAASMQLELKRIQTEVGTDVRARDARPGGGHDDGRHHRGHEPGRHRADGCPERPLREPRDDVRRKLPGPVQPHRGRDPGPRGRAGHGPRAGRTRLDPGRSRTRRRRARAGSASVRRRS